MKITIKLPGGGFIRYEKKPMSEAARFTLFSGLIIFGVFALFVVAALISG